MTEAKQTIRITDTSLRDGSHAMSHRFTKEQVREVAGALDEAGVAVIEVTHGDGLAGSSISTASRKSRRWSLSLRLQASASKQR
jgi:4-hydroxy 2-oxovalerate aldolase